MRRGRSTYREGRNIKDDNPLRVDFIDVFAAGHG